LIGRARTVFNNLIEIILLSGDTSWMPEPKATPKPEQRRGRPKLGKKTVSIRLSEDVLARVRRGAEAGGNLSAYIEQAIKERLEKDNIE
jgi:hypothetical protein